uniref:CCHC-type domain-containing protein n=1 Tax=Schizaphis graminum TaxID=13262 RepID=A0A2S2NR86_SCHGA
MQARVQIKGESNTAYFHNKVRRCKLVNLTFADTKEQVLLGLWSDELSRTHLTTRHTNTNELLADILAYERVKKGRAENSCIDKTPWRLKTVREVDKRISAKLPNVATAGTVASEDKKKSVVPSEIKLRCWNCQMTGHSRRDCPSPRRNSDKCISCHWFGGKHHKTCTVEDKEEGRPNVDKNTMCTSIGPDRRSGGTLHEKQVN